MNEEELAALNAQLKQLIDLQADAAEIMKAKFASLNDPVCYTQKQSRTRTSDGHYSTVNYGHYAADPDKHTHEICLGVSKRRALRSCQPKPTLFQRLVNYFLTPQPKRRKI